MATVSLPLASTLFLASYASTYANARNGQTVTVAEYPWIGQYLGGGQYEVNQVGLSFDQSGLSGPALEANLILTVTESYGATIEVREHDWTEGSTGSFVSTPSTKRLLGSLAVAEGVTGDITIPLNVIGRKSPFKVILTIADQTNNVAPTGDDTILFAGARLEVLPANKSFLITDTGAGSWTPPAGVTSVFVGAHGGGGLDTLGSQGGGGGGAYSAGIVNVTPGPQPYYVAAGQLGYSGGQYRQIVGEDTWFGGTTTILAKGGNKNIGGQASQGFGSLKFSGGNAVGSAGGGAASPFGGGTNGNSSLDHGGDSPNAGLGTRGEITVAESHPDGGGGGATFYTPYNSPGLPAGGAGEMLQGLTSSGQITLHWYEPDAPVGVGGVSLSSPRVQSASTFTQPVRQAAGVIALAPMVVASGLSIVPANGSAGVSLRSPPVAALGTFSAPPSGADVEAVTAWRSPGSLASIVDGNRSWQPLTAANLAVADGTNIVRATGINSTAISHVLRSYNFGFTNSDIPSGATITGVEIELVRRRSFGSGVPFARHARLSVDSGIRTVEALADQIGTNNTTDVEWTNSFTTAPYGGATDTWGANLTAELIINPNFGFDYGLQGGAASMDAAVDQLRMRVHYTIPGGSWAVGVITTRGPYVTASAGQNTQANATVSLTAPRTVAEAYRGSASSGAITLSNPHADGAGTVPQVISGSVSLTVQTQGSGLHGVAGSSSISLAPKVDGSAEHRRAGSGVVSMASPAVAGDVLVITGANGAISLSSPSTDASGHRGARSEAAVLMRSPAVQADGSQAVGANGSVSLAQPTVEGSADHGAAGAGAVILIGPSLEAYAEHRTVAETVISLTAPAVEGQIDRGATSEATITLGSPAVAGETETKASVGGAISLAAPTVQADGGHGIAGEASVSLASPSVEGSGLMVPSAVVEAFLTAPRVSGVMSQTGYARIVIAAPVVDADADHGVGGYGVVELSSPTVEAEAGHGVAGEGSVLLWSPKALAEARRGSSSDGAIPIGSPRLAGVFEHAVGAGGSISLHAPTTLADASHGVGGEGVISLASPTVAGSLEPGLVHGSGGVVLGGVAVDGAAFIDLTTIYTQGAISLSSPGVKGRALTLPTHGQRTVLVAGEQRVVAPVNEPRSLNIGNEQRVITVAPE